MMLSVTRYVSKYFPPTVNPADFDHSSFGERLDAARRIMAAEGRWFEDGLQGLLFYIESAERIDINLEGVEPGHLRQATVGLGRLAETLAEIEAPYTTAWEINQVFHKNLLGKAWFHTGRAMTRWQAFRAMGSRVPLRRILNDNRHLLDTFEMDNKDLEELGRAD